MHAECGRRNLTRLDQRGGVAFGALPPDCPLGSSVIGITDTRAGCVTVLVGSDENRGSAMASAQELRPVDASDLFGNVSNRFMTSFFRALAQHELAATALLGDLPIAIDDRGRVLHPVQWDAFCEFLRRLEHQVGGSEGLEACGEWLCGVARVPKLQRLFTSPKSLYRAVARLVLRRAIPGVEVVIGVAEQNRLRLEIRSPDALRACPQLLHLATGATRALPRIFAMPAAIVTAEVDARRAEYDVRIPSSRTVLARIACLLRAVLSPGSRLRQLEDEQMALHARHALLARAHEELVESERRLRALSDAAVDTLCEIDADGRIRFISASVRDLMGYSREQVNDSHYRLWLPTHLHPFAKDRFETLRLAPIGTAIVKERIELHAAHGRRVSVEVSVRSHQTPSGEWRAVACLRDAASPIRQRRTGRRVTRIVEHVLAGSPRENTAVLPEQRAQSGTRSMSAPRARSFSSIRS